MAYSRQREVLLEKLRSTTSHPTAEAVFEMARQELPHISLGTVYRNLSLLAAQGLIDTLETEDNRLHYDGNTQPHAHFICRNCGRILDVFAPVALPEPLQDLGVTVDAVKCVFYGCCPLCKNG